MTAGFLAFLGIGKLIIYFVQKFVGDNIKNEFLSKLVSCDLCLGAWVYSFIGVIYKVQLLPDLFPYVTVVSGVIAGIFASFLMHLLTLGWKSKFDVVVI